MGQFTSIAVTSAVKPPWDAVELLLSGELIQPPQQAKEPKHATCLKNAPALLIGDRPDGLI
jgi:hypothetical protein